MADSTRWARIATICVLLNLVDAELSPVFAETGDDPVGAALQAEGKKGQDVLTAIQAEIGTIVDHKSALESTKAFAPEEAASLRSRFPHITVDKSYTPDQFIRALQDERQYELGVVADAFHRAADHYEKVACDNYYSAIAIRKKIFESSDFRDLPLSERLGLRRDIDAAMAEGTKNQVTPCVLADDMKKEVLDPELARSLSSD